MQGPLRRVKIGLAALGLVVVAGTVGFLVLGYSLLDSVYQTVLTITTVGFDSHRQLHTGAKVFNILLILVGVGTALYTFSVVFEVLVEGHVRDLVRRRRMDRDISAMAGHVIVCGWGRVGREVARFLAASGREVVVVDRDATRLEPVPYPVVVGDVTDDETLERAGISRAATMVAALDTDSDNLYATMAGKSLQPDIQIIARARSDSSEPKLRRAGADRVVNPQQLGGDRMAAFVTQPHVVDFIDVVMHEGSLEFRLQEVELPVASPLAGGTLSSAQVRERTGALILAIRRPDGSFITNPTPHESIGAGDVLIGIGTAEQLAALVQFAAP
ncbi:MAG TPA: potassium channel protein [Acidimicrobiales bacterium]|nr:potassium channel protein [Acidimicrobiales bacterium]